MREWFILGVAFFLMAVVWTLLQSREDEEMFIRLAAAISGRFPAKGAGMTNQRALHPFTPGSFNLLWTLVTRSIGLTAGLAVALLLMAALISTP